MIIRRRIKDEPAIYQRDKRPPSRPTPAAPALISMRHSARPLTIYDNCHYPVRGGRRPSISAAASSVKDSAPLIRQNLALPPMTPERGGGGAAREASMMAVRRGFKSPLSESISIRPEWTTGFVPTNEVCGGSRQDPGPAARYRPGKNRHSRRMQTQEARRPPRSSVPASAPAGRRSLTFSVIDIVLAPY